MALAGQYFQHSPHNLQRASWQTGFCTRCLLIKPCRLLGPNTRGVISGILKSFITGMSPSTIMSLSEKSHFSRYLVCQQTFRVYPEHPAYSHIQRHCVSTRHKNAQMSRQDRFSPAPGPPSPGCRQAGLRTARSPRISLQAGARTSPCQRLS